jgi:SAM-dependent methyltransferase
VIFGLGASAVLVTWVRMMATTTVDHLKASRLKLQKQLRDEELQVLERSQLGDGQQGPNIPGGLVVDAGGGLAFYANIWENEFRDGVRYGRHFEWIAPWKKVDTHIKPHLKQGGHILQVQMQNLFSTSSSISPLFVEWQVGCGNSELAAQLHEAGFQRVSSIDVSPSVIKQMRSAHPEKKYPGLTYEVMDACHMTFHAAFFDTVIDKATLEAIPQMYHAAYLLEMTRVLRLGGKYIVITSCASIPVPDAMTRIKRSFISRVDHAKDEGHAYLHVFVNDPEKTQEEVLEEDDDGEWRAPIEEDDDDEPDQDPSARPQLAPFAGHQLPTGPQNKMQSNKL